MNEDDEVIHDYEVLDENDFEDFADYLAHQHRKTRAEGIVTENRFVKIPFDLNSKRNIDEKQKFEISGIKITHIVCVGGHSVMIDTGNRRTPPVKPVTAACTTFFFNRLGECALIADNKNVQTVFKELLFTLEIRNKDENGKPNEQLDAGTFLSCIDDDNDMFIGVKSPLTINTKDTKVHDLYTFCGGELFGDNPEIIPSCFKVLTVGTNGIFEGADQVDTLFEKNYRVVIEGNRITGSTHFKKGTRDRVTLGDIYSTISNIPGLDLNTTALVFFGCRTIPGRGIVRIGSRVLPGGGKRKTKANKKNVRIKRKTGSRRKWRHTMRRMRRVRK